MLPVVGERLYEKYARTMYEPSFLDWGWPEDSIRAQIWAIENVLGKTPEEQVKILAAEAFASKEMTARGFDANDLLAEDWPEKWREEVLAHFSELGSEQKLMILDQYRVMFPGDSRLAELAKGDSASEVRLEGVSRLASADATPGSAATKTGLLTRDRAAWFEWSSRLYNKEHSVEAAAALCDLIRSKGAYPDAAGATGTRGDVDILLHVLEASCRTAGEAWRRAPGSECCQCRWGTRGDSQCVGEV